MNRWTQLVHFDPNPGDPFNPNTTPIYQTATFAQGTIGTVNKYDYTRSGNPTRSIVEQQVAALESGKHGFAFASGMAALTIVIGLLKSGDHIVASNDLYGGTHRLLSQRLSQRNITYSLVDTSNVEAVAETFKPETRMILIETPSNPLLKISDIETLAGLAHANNALLVVDNTLLSPWLQQPLLFGADLVMHSATKHLAGHSDVTAGILVTNDDLLAEKIAFIQNCEGSALAPFESWLLLRGLKTLGLRIERQQQTAEKIAAFLQTHLAVKQVYYPSFAPHSESIIHYHQAKGGGTLLSFETGSVVLSRQILDNTKLFTTSVSFGSLNSLISLPCEMSHASISKDKQTFKSDLIRLSIGIEDPEELIMDLKQILELNSL